MKLYDFLLQQVNLEPAEFTSVNFKSYAEGGYTPRLLATDMLYFSECTESSVDDVLLTEPVLAFSFEETGIHHEGKRRRQLGCNHTSREQAEYVLFQFKVSLSSGPN